MKSTRTASVLLGAVALFGALLTFGSAPVSAKATDSYAGPYFGDGNLPPACVNDIPVREQVRTGVASGNVCHYMRTDTYGLDSPQVDVLVMVPVSPTAERDMRIMRQSIEMWEGGIEQLATEMGLDWLADGMVFHITVDYFDAQGGQGGEFTTYPVVDPEIVVIATNPVGGGGIGTDPWPPGLPCHSVGNPFDFDAWDSLPGFNSHHDRRTGTYVEDCGGSGGNVCFAINGAIDPAPDLYELGSLFELVSHEFGHCLTIGHVGDATAIEGHWGSVPTNDIMAYDSDPPGRNKCVSTLDVEGVALRMSFFLDVNGDAVIDDGDHLLANDQIGEGNNPFQVQQPDDHWYASTSGAARDCPQPGLGIVPGPSTDWTPG